MVAQGFPKKDEVFFWDKETPRANRAFRKKSVKKHSRGDAVRDQEVKY